MYDSLPARLAIQNRAFEGGSLDSFRKGVSMWTQAGDMRTAEMIDTILADEIQHVRTATRWLKQMVADNPRVLMKVASAMAALKQVVGALSPRPGEVSANGLPLIHHDSGFRVSQDDRKLAGFSEDEVVELIRKDQAEAASAEPHGRA
jgi:hypothetical protein